MSRYVAIKDESSTLDRTQEASLAEEPVGEEERVQEEESGDMGAKGDHGEGSKEVVVTNATSHRPRRLQAANVRLKREDLDAGLIRCPACECGVSVGTRGCSVTTCTNASPKHVSKSGRRGARERERERERRRDKTM